MVVFSFYLAINIQFFVYLASALYSNLTSCCTFASPNAPLGLSLCLDRKRATETKIAIEEVRK